MHQSVRILLFNPAHELLFMGAEDKNLTGADGNKGRFWFLVGGTLEAGETFQAAAKRELTEEERAEIEASCDRLREQCE